MPRFNCHECNYITNKSSHFQRHMNSKKHKQMVNLNTLNPETVNENEEILSPTHICEYCGKEYKFLKGLTKHKSNTCMKIDKQNITNSDVENTIQDVTETFTNHKSSATQPKRE